MNAYLRPIAGPLLRWTLGIVVLIQSLQLALAPMGVQFFARTGLPQWVRLSLAWTEIAAAILFIVPFTTRTGSYVLVGVFAFASVLHILHGRYDIGASVVYTTAVLVNLAFCDDETADPAHV